ncbi:glutathione S-transferase family protein [Paucibacter sp. APW11]|uniref:Glutathione S-transferase family protein n=1 Tax=Roseateles aquae TaxID=3077235 RepID=A0ABU3PAQ1_9BURK|nr:glutathione S-transferase family protein [Paucibacter sp. APW11]MDT8999654.1 glutathione S-transferase family protein [Paucibacter sp. APW11]
MKLVIGNKNYSSWSMRPWVLLKHFGIAFEEVKLRFDFTPDSAFYRELARFSPVGKVPVLIEDDGFAVWDSLAITEYIADRHPDLPIWPREVQARARARSLCAEMHSGYAALRGHCPMNIDADLAAVGQRLLATEPKLQQDLNRLCAAWSEALQASGGPFLFGEFSAADAFFAPVVMRVTRYSLPLPAVCQSYAEAVSAAAGVRDWISDALAERDFLDFEEPYRAQP